VETEAAVAPSASLPKAVLARTPEEAKSQYIAARITEAQGYFAELDPEEQEAAISRGPVSFFVCRAVKGSSSFRPVSQHYLNDVDG
jgi:hypothetical protein